jgi:hypothetical protein
VLEYWIIGVVVVLIHNMADNIGHPCFDIIVFDANGYIHHSNTPLLPHASIPTQTTF